MQQKLITTPEYDFKITLRNDKLLVFFITIY